MKFFGFTDETLRKTYLSKEHYNLAYADDNILLADRWKSTISYFRYICL